MKDEEKTKEQLINELILMRQRINELEALKTKHELERDLVRSILESSPDSIIITDLQAVIVDCNSEAWKLAGCKSKEELIGQNAFEFIVEKDRSLAAENAMKVLREGSAKNLEYLVRTVDGREYPAELSTGLMCDSSGVPVGFVGILKDITERKLVEEKLRTTNQQLLDIIEFLPDATFVIDLDKKVIAWNRAIEEMTGVHKEDIIGKGDYAYAVPFYGKPMPGLIELVFAENREVELQYEYIERKENKLYAEAFVPFLDEEKGAYLWMIASPLYDSKGDLVGAIETIRDITERKQMEKQLKYLSLHDPLTLLYNRTYFEQEMRRLEGGRYVPIGIIVCDIDGLKFINDTFGHEAGDTLLVAAADALKKSFREGDMVARIGGDEFAVLLPETERVSVESACQRVRDTIGKYNVKNPELPISISIGFAVTSDASKSMAELFREADNNMYREKLHRRPSARSAFVQILAKALEAKDFLTEGHVERLQDLVVNLARVVGLTEHSLNDLRLLAQFHDIGKVSMPDRILFKPGPLNPDEVIEMQQHCEIGHRIALSIPDLIPIADWILKHHEWWNGQGYPAGLKGEEIPLECRILAIVDAYEAMTSKRPYRKAMTHEEALAELKRCSGVQFDMELLNKFIQLLESRG